MDRLARLHRDIRACTKCVAAGYLATAMPILAGTSTDHVAIVGQAPGAIEITTGLPFTGRSGSILRAWLADAGIDEAHLPYRTAVTKCFPGKARSGAGDRRPSPAEIELCAPWLEQELALLRPRVVLLVGTLAIERLWGRVPLASVIGTLRRETDRVLIPLPHPSGASRWLNGPANRSLLRKALLLVRKETRSFHQPLDNARIAGRMHRSR